MKKGVLLFVVGVLTFFGAVLLAHTDLETVWLKDMTSSFQTDKRTISDLDLPDDLTFHLSRGSHAVNLSLKRNHGIDPNAEVYVVRKLKDGRSIREKTRHLEKEDVAYYQDRENGAFMTVRCDKRSNGQCDRVISWSRTRRRGGGRSLSRKGLFIMTPEVEEFKSGDTYSRNPWLFSNCSVESFKATLSNKTCLLNKGVFFNEKEWGLYVRKKPGERNTLHEQCKPSNGPKSRFCGDVSADICLFMKCTDPNTGACLSHNFIAASGTKCGENIWCIEGRCV